MHKSSLDAVLSRMMNFLNVKTDSALARELDVNRQTFAGWRKRDSVPYAECINFCEARGVSLDWLLTGVGPIYRSEGEWCGAGAPSVGNEAEQAMLSMWRELDAEHQRDIQRALEEKKRLITLEKRLTELEAVVSSGKTLA